MHRVATVRLVVLLALPGLAFAQTERVAPADVCLQPGPPGSNILRWVPCTTKKTTRDPPGKPVPAKPNGGEPGVPPAKSGERIEVVWFITRVDDAWDTDAVGPFQMTQVQANAFKSSRDSVAKGRYGKGAKVMMAISDQSFPCGFVYRARGSRKYGFSPNRDSVLNQRRLTENFRAGAILVGNPACRP
jgi:hypothetical protein